MKSDDMEGWLDPTYLVLEGWIPDHGYQSVVKIFEHKPFDEVCNFILFLTGDKKGIRNSGNKIMDEDLLRRLRDTIVKN